MQSPDQIQWPCQPKVVAKHPGVAVALEELHDQRSDGGHRSSLEESYGNVSGKKNRASFQAQFPCKFQVIVKKPLQNPGDF